MEEMLEQTGICLLHRMQVSMREPIMCEIGLCGWAELCLGPTLVDELTVEIASGCVDRQLA